MTERLRSNGNSVQWNIEQYNDDLRFFTESTSDTGGVVRVWIDQDGRLGLGATPDDALDVVGDIDATGCVQTDDTGSIWGTCISDRRLKTNIKTIADNALGIITALNPVRFDWNAQAKEIYGEEGENIGFIAQELETILPHLVVDDTDTGYKKVKYTQEINMLLIKAVKEQQAVIEKQEKRLTNQNDRLEVLEKILSNN